MQNDEQCVIPELAFLSPSSPLSLLFRERSLLQHLMTCWHPANVANTMETACVLATPAFHNLNTIRLPSTLVPPTSYSFGNTLKGERGSRRHQYPVILAAVRKGPEILLVRCYRMAVGIYCTVRKRVVTSLQARKATCEVKVHQACSKEENAHITMCRARIRVHD